MTDTVHTHPSSAPSPTAAASHSPLLTVVVPVYRVERTLDEAVESILAQGVDLEVVLVDDGSPDRCPALCDAWAARDTRVRTLHRPNGGLSAARNDGIAAARGAYITFVDSDDRLEAGTYAPLMAMLLAHPEYDMIEYSVRSEGRPDNATALRLEAREYDSLQAWWFTARGYTHTYAWNKIFRRHLFDTLRFPVGRTFEDAHTIPQAIARARCIATTPHGTYIYRWNPHGITARACAADLSSLLDAHLDIIRHLDIRPDGRDKQTYWLHAANIQITLCRITGEQPRLPQRWLNPLLFTGHNRWKALAVDLLGMRGIARMFGQRKK